MTIKEALLKNYTLPVWKIILFGFIALIVTIPSPKIEYKDKIVYQDKITYQDRIVEKQVVTNDCNKELKAIDTYKKVLALDGKAFDVCGDLLRNMFSYYIYNPDAIRTKGLEVKAASDEKWTLINQDYSIK